MCAGLVPVAQAQTHTLAGPEQPRTQTIAALANNADREAVARRERSNDWLRANGIPVNDNLPARSIADETVRRDSDAVIDRLLALAVVAVHASEMDRGLTDSMIYNFDVADVFTPEEMAFLQNEAPTRDERAKYSWAFENVEVLLWAVGLREELGHPGEVCDIDAIADTLLSNGSFGLRRRAELRSQEEIMDQADLIYRMHWALRQAQIEGEAPPAGMVWDVVFERHYALNWLIGYMDQPWDEVSTDT